MKTAMDIPDKEGQKRLVIVGGGFGGLKLAITITSSNRYSIKWPQQVLNRVPYHSHTEKSSKKESISIYVFVKHSKSSRNTICWRLPSARWHTTIWSLPPAATQIIL